MRADVGNGEFVCADKGEHRARIESRAYSAPGLKSPTWEDVLNTDYHPWTDERVQLDTGGKTSEQSLEELVSRLESRGIPK